MKRLISLAVSMLLLLGCLSAQENIVNSLVGCHFHDNGMSVRTKLRAKFGVKPTKDFGKEVVYTKVEIGGVHYDEAHFFFRYNSQAGHSEFVSAVLKKRFLPSDRAKAIEYYQTLKGQYNRKYLNMDSSDQEGSYQCWCGEKPDTFEGDKYPIRIALDENVAHTGDKYIFVTVTYYASELESLYDEEI